MANPCSETAGEWITFFLQIKVFIEELRGILLQIHLTADFSTVIQRNIHCQLFLLWSHPSPEKIIVFLESIVLFTRVERGRDGKKEIESLLWLNWLLHVIVQLPWDTPLHVFLLFSLEQMLLCLELSTPVSNLAVYSWFGKMFRKLQELAWARVSPKV